MIFMVKLDGIRVYAETDEDVSPEVAEDYLNRCARVAMDRIYAAIPDATPEAGPATD